MVSFHGDQDFERGVSGTVTAQQKCEMNDCRERVSLSQGSITNQSECTGENQHSGEITRADLPTNEIVFIY